MLHRAQCESKEDQLHDPPQSEVEEGINTLSFPFDDGIFTYVSYS